MTQAKPAGAMYGSKPAVAANDAGFSETVIVLNEGPCGCSKYAGQIYKMGRTLLPPPHHRKHRRDQFPTRMPGYHPIMARNSAQCNLKVTKNVCI